MPVKLAACATKRTDAITPTNGADTTVIFRVQVDATTPAGDYTGNVNYTVLPNS